MNYPDATDLERRLSNACPTTQHAAIIMARRDAVGIQKYGQTVDENHLSACEWAHHAVEEAADGLKYAIRAREEAEKLEMEVQALRTANAALVDAVANRERERDHANDTADAALAENKALVERNKELLEFAERLAAFPLEEFGWQSRKDSQPIHGWNDYTLYVSDIKRARNLVSKTKGHP